MEKARPIRVLADAARPASRSPRGGRPHWPGRAARRRPAAPGRSANSRRARRRPRRRGTARPPAPGAEPKRSTAKPIGAWATPETMLNRVSARPSSTKPTPSRVPQQREQRRQHQDDAVADQMRGGDERERAYLRRGPGAGALLIHGWRPSYPPARLGCPGRIARIGHIALRGKPCRSGSCPHRTARPGGRRIAATVRGNQCPTKSTRRARCSRRSGRASRDRARRRPDAALRRPPPAA